MSNTKIHFSPDPAQVSVLVGEVNQATARFTNEPDETSRLQMLKSIAKMMGFVSNPLQEVFRIIGMTHLSGAIRSAIEIGLFNATPVGDETITASELEAKTGAEKLLVVRLMRALTSNGIFVEVDKQTYKHNQMSMQYTIVSVCDLVKHLTDHMLPVTLQMNQYLRTIYFQNPADQKPGPFQYVNKTDEDFFNWVKKRPESWKKFNSGMQATNLLNPTESVSAFAFDTELSDVGENDVAIIDIGGGRGDALMSFKETYSQVKGQFILQDLPGVLAGVSEAISKKGIQLMEYDFFTPQPVKGARVYHFRRVLHDWSDNKCRKILQNTIWAMDPEHSRIVIADLVLPERNVSPQQAILDLNMMILGAMERTEDQWKSLLESVGLKLVKIWRSKDGVQAALEARLK